MLEHMTVVEKHSGVSAESKQQANSFTRHDEDGVLPPLIHIAGGCRFTGATTRREYPRCGSRFRSIQLGLQR